MHAQRNNLLIKKDYMDDRKRGKFITKVFFF